MKIIKRIRQKGKLRFSEYFKKLNIGDSVAIVAEPSIPFSYQTRLIGKTGEIISSRGRSKIVKLKDGNATRQIIIHPIHLRRLSK